MDIFSYMLGAKRGGGGGVLSWNDLTDKPFYEEVTEVMGDTLTWDGNTEGLAVFQADSNVLYRVSDVLPEHTDLANGGSFVVVQNGEQIPVPFTSGDVISEASDLSIIYNNGKYVAVVLRIDVAEMGWQKGLYLANNGMFYMGGLTLNGYTGFTTTTTVLKTLDPKYLPEALQFGETTVKGDTLTWDGNTEGLLSVSAFEQLFWYKVSDTVLTIDDATNGFYLNIKTPEGDQAAEIPAEGVQNFFKDDGGFLMDTLLIGAPTENYAVKFYGGDVVFPEPGIYFQLANGTYVSEFKIPGYTGFTQTVIKPMDEKYMPILTSPSGKKFKLTVDDSGTVSAVEVTE